MFINNSSFFTCDNGENSKAIDNRRFNSDNDFLPKNNNESNNKITESVCSKQLIALGFSMHLSGFTYLKSAIMLVLKKPRLIKQLTTVLYPHIAERFERSVACVERAMRHAIEEAWNRKGALAFNSLYGVQAYTENEKPSIGEFIAYVAEYLRLEGFN